MAGFDTSKWPKGVRQITLEKMDGLGIDENDRLHWDGRPVQMVQRLDLTKWQAIGAFLVGFAVVVTALATLVVAGVSYHEWACKTGWPSVVECPQQPLFSE